MSQELIYSRIPSGWSHDKGDPSVGIFGDSWTHEDCQVLQGPGNGDSHGCREYTIQSSDPDVHGMALFYTKVTCLDCWKITSFESPVFVGLDDPDNQ